MKDTTILGVRVDDVTYAEVCERVAAWVAQDGPHQIATVNPEFIMLARRDPHFYKTLQRTALNVPDGIGVLYAARRLGQPLRQRVAGIDLMQCLCERAAQQGWRVFLLGAGLGVAELAAAKLGQQHPGLLVVGTHAGSARPEDRDEIIARVQQTQPQLLFVAYGAPAQDNWLAENLGKIATGHAVVGMGVGGSFDFIVGTQQRAPKWVQRVGFEWLDRLLRDPKRWRRQMALPQFAALVMLESFRRH